MGPRIRTPLVQEITHVEAPNPDSSTETWTDSPLKPLFIPPLPVASPPGELGVEQRTPKRLELRPPLLQGGLEISRSLYVFHHLLNVWQHKRE